MPIFKFKKRFSLLCVVAIVLFLVAIALYANYYPDLSVEKLKTTYGKTPSRFIEVNGQQVHYRDEGKGPALLLIHGTAASLHTWDGWVDALSDSFRIIRFDLPAFGLTGPNEKGDYSTATYVKFVNDFTNKIGLQSFHLAGNSLGGNIAWNFAAEHPEKVKKLILLAPSGLPILNKKRPLAFRLASNSSLRWLVRYVTPKQMVRKSLKEVYADDSKVDDKLVKRYHELLRRDGNRMAFIDRVEQIQVEDSTQLAKIKSPVLLQWGEGDIWLPVSLLPRFQALLPANAKAIRYPNTGHVPMEENPALTAKDAADFLREPVLGKIPTKPILMKR